jgi:hypothetical protein
MADDPRTRTASANDGTTGRREGRMRRFMEGVSPYLSLFAFLIAVGTAAWVFWIGRADVSNTAFKGYSFGSPEDALKSVLTMRKNGEFTALRSFDVAFNNAVIDEKISTLKIEKTLEYDGRRILFISYKERGDTKYATEAYIRDAHSGLWGPTRYEYYDVRDREIAGQMRSWLDGNTARG